MSWVTPTGHIDSSGTWDNETQMYDDDENIYGQGSVPGANQWSEFVVFTHAAMTSDRMRVNAAVTVSEQIDMDAHVDGGWVDVFEGAVVDHAWMEKTFSQGSVDEIRIRLQKDGTGSIYVYEVDFYEVAAGGLSIPVAMHHYSHHIGKIIRG